MRDSRISLPPLVEGPARGALRLSLGAPRWAEAAPAHLRQHAGDVVARVEWWGDASGGDLVPLPPPPAAAATAACLSFPLRTGPKYLARYLKDMGALTVTIEPAPGSDSSAADAGGAGEAVAPQPLAAATVGLLALDVQAPIRGTYPLVLVADEEGAAASDSGAGRCGAASEAAAIVGSLEVSLELDFSSSSGAAALVSSFELNEHLAGSVAAAGVAAEDAEDAGSDDDGGHSASSASDGDTAPTAQLAGLCEQLLFALQSRELVASALQQLGYSDGAADAQPAMEGLQLQPLDVGRLLPLLLPAASQPQLDYVAAMLQPFAEYDREQHAPTSFSLGQLAAAAGEGAAMERELASQPAAEALQGLRQAAAALASRSLDLTAAFAAADGKQLTLCQLGTLLQQLHPGATADEARRLLAVVAAGGSSVSSVTLPALKAALARVQEAQQFPTAEDLARQQAAVEARRAKEAAAAAVAAIEQQRAAAAAAAKVPPSQRKQAVVSKLKSSLQDRRRSSTSGGSLQVETQVAPAPAEQLAEPLQQQAAQLPAVVLGIPVLPPPPPALELLTGLPAQAAATEPAAAAPLPGPPTSAAEAPGASAASGETQPLQTPALPEAPLPPPPPPQQLQQQHQAAQPQQPQQDALLQLIQQAEALKAAMQQASTGSSDAVVSIPARSQLCTAATAAPRLPNLLLPLATQAAPTAAGAAADCNGLSAATADLLAAARSLRLESEQMPQPGAVPASAAPSSAALLSARRVPTLPAAAPAAAPAAVLGSAVAAAGDSDAESDAEDALLDQLFFQRTRQPAEVAGTASPKRLADSPAPQAAAQREGEAVQLVLRVQLGPPQLAGPSGRSSSGGGINSSVRCVVKPLRAGGLPQQLNVPVASAAGAAAVAVELPVLGGVGSSDGRLPLLPPYLFLEFWRHSGDLLGIARVPLLQPPACGPVQRGFPAAVVAEGRHAISDILEGRDAGTIHVAAVLQEKGAPPLAAAVRHCFSVAIRSAHRLPSAAAYAGAGLRAPDARLLRYSFPGEPDALQTGEVPCCSSPCFDATATHEMALPAGHSILPLLQDGLLRFELFDCWADQQQRQQHGWALLQLRELASLAAEAEGSGSASSAARQGSRTLLLPLCTEYESAGAAAGAAGAGEAAARGPSLKIELSYQAELCTVDAAEVAAASVEAAPAGRAVGSPAKQERAALEKSAAGAPSGGTNSDSDEENSLLLANRSTSTSSGRQAQHAVHGRPAAGVQPAAAARLPAARSIPAEPFVPATLSVKIIRACGLGAAVREAAAAAGGGAGTSLGRAAVVGPHAFVRLALFPDADAALQAEASPLQTAFVPQSFCPAWRSVHSYPLQLTGSMVEALASQTMRVEVWHRCPRAVAGSSSGREAREVLLGAGAVPLVDVLRKPQGLRCWIPLTPGSSSGGGSASVVGAVQVAACLNSLGRLTSGPAQSEPLLLRCTEAAALVPAPLRSRLLVPPGAGFRGQAAVLAVHLDTLVPPASSSLSGGRPKADRFFCRYSLPGSDGSSTATASRVLSSVGSSVPAGPQRKGASRGGAAGSGAVEQQRWAAKLNHSGFFEVTADASLAAALLQGPLAVHVYKQPAGAATEAGRSAVLVGTAEVDLSPLLWADSGSSSGSGAGQAANGQLHSISGTYPLLEGASAALGGASLAAQVELQLQPEEGAAQQAAAAAAAGVHTAALERPKPASEQQQLVPAAAPAAPAPAGDEQLSLHPELRQRLLQQQEQLLGSPSSSDDDEAHEELLQRCQRLTAALHSVFPAETAAAAPVSGHADEGAGTRSGGAAEEQPAAGTSGAQQPAERQAAGGSQAADSSTGSALLPERPQSGDPSQADGGSPSAAVVQQDQPVGPDEPEEAGKLLLQIDSALHLPVEAPCSGSSTSSDSYSAFVAAAWGSEQQRTAVVPVHVVAAAELGGTAVWHAELELPAAASQWQSQAHTRGGSGSGSGSGPNLVLHVWATPGTPGSSGGSGGSGQQGSAADSLLGCCVLDLRVLPALQQVAGYWHIVDSQQQQQQQQQQQRRGQLKASVRANRALRDALQQQRSRLGESDGAAVAGMAAGGAAPQQPQQAPNADAASVEDQQGQPAAAGDDDLAQQVQAQLEGLELLSQRLVGAPASPAAVAGAAAAGTAPQSAGQADRSPALAAPAAVAQQAQPHASLHSTAAGAPGNNATVEALLAAAGPLQADAEVVKPFDALPASDDEWDGSALPLDPRQEGLFAWSGSDSDDGMGLVGIAVDGAISGEVTEEEEEQPRAPARLLAEDWMFAISKTAVESEEERLAAEQAAGQQQQRRQQAEGQPGQRRAPVRFRNVIPGGALGGAAGREPTAPLSHLEHLAVQQQREEVEEQATQALLQHSSAAEAAAAAAAAQSAAAVQAARAAAAQGPTLHQFGAMPTGAAVQPAPVQLQQPLPRRQQLPGGLQPGWQFDIRREPAVPSAGTAGSLQQPAPWEQHSSATSAATPSSVRLDQFGAQQATPPVAATPASLLAQQRSELQQRSQEARSPAAAATIDEVLAQLRGRGRGAAGAGGTADRNRW